jgi:hypothetical protein
MTWHLKASWLHCVHTGGVKENGFEWGKVRPYGADGHVLREHEAGRGLNGVFDLMQMAIVRAPKRRDSQLNTVVYCRIHCPRSIVSKTDQCGSITNRDLVGILQRSQVATVTRPSPC